MFIDTRRTLESLSDYKTDPDLKKFTAYNPKTGGKQKLRE